MLDRLALYVWPAVYSLLQNILTSTGNCTLAEIEYSQFQFKLQVSKQAQNRKVLYTIESCKAVVLYAEINSLHVKLGVVGRNFNEALVEPRRLVSR